ncbi:hypothetical protein GCM10028819_14760 [Spirosoma humi]
MRKIAAIGLLSLLLCHILAHMLVVWMISWQEESDLSSRLSVYRSVDSLVEFYIPLHQQAVQDSLQTHPTEGFVYRDNYYDIVRQEIKNDTLLILGYANKQGSFWQQNLLDFINQQVESDSNSLPEKANQLLKNLLNDYYQGVRFVINFCHPSVRVPVLIPTFTAILPTLVLPVNSPPPEA